MADEKIIFSMVGVSKTFTNQKKVLNNIYLSFFYGAKIGIVGMNGAGKSTLMKIIAGLDKNFEGEVVFSPGYSVGYLEQEPKLDEDATVIENIRQAFGDLLAKIDRFKGMILQVREKYPNAQVFATTLREVVSANMNMWGAIMLAGDQWFVEEPRAIDILDRVGGGDGFTGGLLYGILKDWEPEKWIQFGWATGAMAAASLNDYAEPADEKQVWAIHVGNARVQR